MVAQAGHAVADELGSDVMLRHEPLALGDPVGVRRDSQIRRAPNSSGLYDVLDLILDKGIVIDAFVRVSLVGIELLTVDLRVVIASVDTYLRYAEGVERLQVYTRSGSKKLPDMVGGGMRTHAIKKGVDKVKDAIGGDDDDQDSDDEGGGRKEGLAGALTHGVRHILKKGVGGILHNVKGDSDDEGEQEDDDRGDEEREEREPARQSRGTGNAGRAKAGSRR
jgi:gas vesicle structural protein